MPIKEIELRPLRETVEDYDRLERTIIDLLRREIYQPLIELIPHANSETIKNSNSPLESAILAGRVRYYRGQFKGSFSSATSKELRAIGAEWERKTRSWKLPQSKMPAGTLRAVQLSESRFITVLEKINRKLQELAPEKIADAFAGKKIFDSSLYKVNKDFKESIKGVTVAPTLTDEVRGKIAEQYTDNMKLYIRDFAKKEITKLRKEVAENVFAGNRYEALTKNLQDSYGVSQRKAKFLARQETSLLMSKFKAARYQEAGVDEYKWVAVAGSKLHPVRPSHEKLAQESKRGKTFRFSDPPYIDAKEGHANPGEPFGCRCTAKPVVRFRTE